MFGRSEFTDDDRERLQRLEEKLDLILYSLGLETNRQPDNSPQDEEWQQYARDYQKIQAVKAYREVYHCGLRDAKIAVEDYMRQEGI